MRPLALLFLCLTGCNATLRDAMQLKPYRHHFEVGGEVQILRFMNMTGG